MSNIMELQLKTSSSLSKVEFIKESEIELEINSLYSLFVQIDSDGDTIYLSINRTKDDEIKNVHRISGSLSIEDSFFNFEITKERYNEVARTDLSELEVSELDCILDSVLYKLKKEFKINLLKLSNLSLEDSESRFVWLDLMDGFSDTWKKGEAGFKNVDEFLCSFSREDYDEYFKGMKLIEYKCHTDHAFEFNKNMKLK